MMSAIVTRLRHSITVLVKRYAHLSQSHLMSAVEGVAGFGKTAAMVPGNQVLAEESRPIQNGTVTETGTDGSVGERRRVEVVEKVGAPDPN